MCVSVREKNVWSGSESGEEAGPGRRVRNQRERGEVSEPGLRGAAGPVSEPRTAVLRLGLPGRARGAGLQRARPELVQDPGCAVEETRGECGHFICSILRDRPLHLAARIAMSVEVSDFKSFKIKPLKSGSGSVCMSSSKGLKCSFL